MCYSIVLLFLRFTSNSSENAPHLLLVGIRDPTDASSQLQGGLPYRTSTSFYDVASSPEYIAHSQTPNIKSDWAQPTSSNYVVATYDTYVLLYTKDSSFSRVVLPMQGWWIHVVRPAPTKYMEVVIPLHPLLDRNRHNCSEAGFFFSLEPAAAAALFQLFILLPKLPNIWSKIEHLIGRKQHLTWWQLTITCLSTFYGISVEDTWLMLCYSKALGCAYFYDR